MRFDLLSFNHRSLCLSRRKMMVRHERGKVWYLIFYFRYGGKVRPVLSNQWNSQFHSELFLGSVIPVTVWTVHRTTSVDIKWFDMQNVNALWIGTRIPFSSSPHLSSDRFSVQLLEGWRRYLHDGIKQLPQVEYALTSIHREKLYTHILVNLTRSATKKLEYLLE